MGTIYVFLYQNLNDGHTVSKRVRKDIYVFLYQNLNKIDVTALQKALLIYVFLYQNLNRLKKFRKFKEYEFMYFYIRI